MFHQAACVDCTVRTIILITFLCGVNKKSTLPASITLLVTTLARRNFFIVAQYGIDIDSVSTRHKFHELYTSPIQEKGYHEFLNRHCEYHFNFFLKLLSIYPIAQIWLLQIFNSLLYSQGLFGRK